ncbi:DegT/DnrJ/EryC1/StrS aminotransferase family protein [Telluribacter sp. SYSU D00476]|uniref:DegT/DnrJ/EryC1/StrS family aminotransferase n=1 Tax=Telluribacter sp. SYSU D00476 TaxID=2811430 RepID=UPI001FF6C626|nr:DegT/DnrJ/EryC1/StrS family aminotransferase [Telluribacter sp. SYSU D00476]
MNQQTDLAIHGGAKTVTRTFPWPVFDESEVQAVMSIVQSGAWGNPDCKGEVEAFEKDFAAYCGTRYAVSCVNGSVSLRLALIACGVRPGDEVIVPPYTFIATASTVIEANCVPVFVDIDPATYNISPEAIEAAITERTRAIIPVHFAGQACDMDRIMEIARRHNLRVIEDAAHAHGAEYKGRKLGTIGDVGSFSFQSSKNLNSGEGGIIVTNDEPLYQMMASLRNVGRMEGGQWYDHYNPGCNYRITQLQAVLLSHQLKRLDEQTRTRNQNGLYLNELLGTIDGITPLERGFGETLHAYHLYIFKYDKAKFGGVPKDEFVAMLAAEGVPCFKGYPHPLYRQPLFQQKNFMCYAIPDSVDYTGVFCPVAERACSEEAVWILQPAMLGTREDMESFAQAIIKIQKAVCPVPSPTTL